MKIFGSVAATLLVLLSAALLFIYSGAYDIAASKPHSALTEWLFSAIMEGSVRSHAEVLPSPDLKDSTLIRSGFVHFREMCVTCHGAPGISRSEIGKGLHPEAPELSEEAGEWTPSQLHWIIKRGIKMTGMPAFGLTHSDEEIWSLVAFLGRLQGMDSAGYAARAAPEPPSGADSGSHGHHDGAVHEH